MAGRLPIEKDPTYSFEMQGREVRTFDQRPKFKHQVPRPPTSHVLETEPGHNDRGPMKNENFWISIWLRSINFYYWFPATMPFRFKWDENRGRIVMAQNTFQKVMSSFIQICSFYITWVVLKRSLAEIKLSTSPLKYFDVGIKFSFFIHTFYGQYFVFFRQNDVRVFLQKLSDMKLNRFASKTSIWHPGNIFFFVLFASSIPATISYFCTRTGVSSFDFDQIIGALRAETAYAMGWESWETSDFAQNWPFTANILMIFLSFLNYAEAFNLWMADDLGITGTFFMAQVTRDVFSYFEKMKEFRFEFKDVPNRGPKDISPADDDDKDDLPREIRDYQEGLAAIYEFNEFLKLFNYTFGFSCASYSIYCNAYYALHLVDVLNVDDFRNRYEICTQFMALTFTYMNAASIHINCKKIRQFLSHKDNMLNLSKQQLSLILFDLKPFGRPVYGAGSFFKILPEIVGKFWGFLCTIVICVATIPQ